MDSQQNLPLFDPSQILQSIPHMIFVKDLNDRLLYANTAFEAARGLHASQVIGGSVTSPDEPHTLASLLGDTASVAGDSQHEEQNIRVCIDGDEQIYRRRGFALRDRRGQHYATTWLCEAVTKVWHHNEESEKSKELLVLALKGSDAGFWEWDLPTGKVTFADVELSNEELIGVERRVTDVETLRLLFHPDDREYLTEATRRYLEGGDEHLYLEYRKLDVYGRYRWTMSKRRIIERHGDGSPKRIAGIYLDITDRKEAELALRASHDRLRELANHLQTVREDERTTIARDIHDELGQTLSALRMEIALLRDQAAQRGDDASFRELRTKFASMERTLDDAIRSVRRIVSDLRPSLLDTLGLVTALEWQSQEFERLAGIHCDFVSNTEDADVSKSCGTTLFRIFQETLTNVMRHSQATRVEATLERTAESICLTVRDDGIGFCVDDVDTHTSFGLLGMRERILLLGGVLEVSTDAGLGTTILAEIPVGETVSTGDASP